MRERCKPPLLDARDWEQIDFTRWSLDAVAPTEVSRVIAGLAQQFFDSPEWQENVQATMPQIQQVALGVFKEQASKLRQTRKTAEESFASRTATAKGRADDMRRAMAAAAAPRAPEPTPNAFHLSVRVTGGDAALGFGGVLVEVADPRDQKAAPIAAATTDADGNAVLTIGAGLAQEIEKRDAAISVTAPSGKLLARVADGVCVRVGQVETKVVSVKDSPDTAPLKEAALATRASREVLLESIASRAPALSQEHETRLAALDCRLQDVDAVVAELEKPVEFDELFAHVKPVEPPPAGGGTTPPRGDNPRGGGNPPGGSTPGGSTRPTPAPGTASPVGTPAANAPATPKPATPATPAAPAPPRVSVPPAPPAVRPAGRAPAPVTAPPSQTRESKPAGKPHAGTKGGSTTTKGSGTKKK